MQGMVLDTAVDSNVLSYLVLVFMKDQGAVVERGGASPQSSGEAESSPQRSGEVEPALGSRARQSQPLAIGRGGV